MSSYKKSKKKKKFVQRSYRIFRKRLKRRKVGPYNQKKKLDSLIKKLVYRDSKPPNNFSFINNADAFIKYLSDIGRIFKKGNSLKLDLSDLTNLTFDALCLLKAELKDKNFIGGCYCKGNEPTDSELRKLFRDSGFYEGLFHNEKQLKFNGAMINHRKNIKVVEKIAQIITDEICEHANFSIHPKRSKIYPNIIECMANTHDHATGNCNWWLFYYKEEGTGITKVCFLDLGIGIFQSLGYRLNGTWKNLGEALGISSNAKILQQILKNEIKVPTSKTGKKERGKGLLSLYAFSKETYVRNLRIISNNVDGHISEDTYNILKNNFDGTFIYWEIIPNHV